MGTPSDFSIEPYTAHNPAMPPAQRRRMRDQRIVAKRLREVGISRAEAQIAYSTFELVQTGAGPKWVRQFPVAPNAFSKTHVSKLDKLRVYAVPSRKDKAKRMGKAPLREVAVQLDEVMNVYRSDIDDIVEWLVGEGWSRRDSL